MRLKLLNRINVLLGATVLSLLGMNSCGKQTKKYEVPPVEDMYGVPFPEQVDPIEPDSLEADSAEALGA